MCGGDDDAVVGMPGDHLLVVGVVAGDGLADQEVVAALQGDAAFFRIFVVDPCEA